MTRNTSADQLIAGGEPAALMLDGALLFAEDGSFEVMLEFLAEADQRIQIIFLSCRTNAYRGLQA